MSKILKFEGHNYFRQRLVLATLSGKILKIEKIRSNDANPGLRGNFLSFFLFLSFLPPGRFDTEKNEHTTLLLFRRKNNISQYGR